jgi:hypothetical protein
MRALRFGFVAVAVVALTACPREEPAPPALEEPIIPPATEPAAVAPAGERTNLEPVAGSTVTGEVVAIPMQDRTEVTLIVRNAPPNESVGARILSGTCESPGVEVAGLDAISTDGLGQGQSVTNVGHAPHLIMDGNHIAAVYAPGTQPEQDMPIACATLPAQGQI